MDFLFNAFKIRYVKMNKLFRDLHLNGVKSITLYINLESIINPLHQKSYEEFLASCTLDAVTEEYKRIIANIINIAAHYRLYFTRERVFSSIVFFYNDLDVSDKYNNKVHIKKYRKTYHEMYDNSKYERVNEVIHWAIQYCHKIVDFIDHVYILKSDRLDSSVIPYLCKDTKYLKSDLDLILTKDPYDFQYVNHDFMVLLPHGDDSVILHRGTLIKYLLFKNDMLDKYKFLISPMLYPFILSVTGNKKRNLDKLKGIGFKKLYKELEKLYIQDYLSDENPASYNIEYLNDLIKSSNGFYNTGVRELICNNYYAIDLDRQLNISNKDDNDNILSGLIDRYDTSGLKKLNDKTFADYPINLVELNNYYADPLKDGEDL